MDLTICSHFLIPLSLLYSSLVRKKKGLVSFKTSSTPHICRNLGRQLLERRFKAAVGRFVDYVNNLTIAGSALHKAACLGDYPSSLAAGSDQALDHINVALLKDDVHGMAPSCYHLDNSRASYVL